MDTSINTFEWFEQEISIIKSRRFHILEPLMPEDLSYKGVHLVEDYLVFMEKFGHAMLFTNHQDSPVLNVYPLKDYRRHKCADGKVYIGFACRSYQSVYFDEEVVLRGEQSKVYTVTIKKASELSPNFSEWFLSAYQWAKSKYSPRQWKCIIDGPKPFTMEELRIVNARKSISWQPVGFTASGNVKFRIKNNSDLTLPFLSIGVQGKGETILIGGVWLDISLIKPGETTIIEHDCYVDQIPRDKLEFFEKPEPIPEKREAYWEFGMPK